MRHDWFMSAFVIVAFYIAGLGFGASIILKLHRRLDPIGLGLLMLTYGAAIGIAGASLLPELLR